MSDSSSQEDPSKAQIKVLIVDDDAINRDILSAMLDELNYVYTTATNGEEAVETALSYHPDIILMDVEMPIMNGLDACKTLKQNENLAAVPVVFLTGLSDETVLRKAFDVGGADYLVKPFRFVELAVRVKNHVAFYRLQRNLQSQVKQKTDEVIHTRALALRAIASLAETRDPETGAHINRVQHFVKVLGEELLRQGEFDDQLTYEYIQRVFNCSPLHDIGKVGIPDNILLKPGRLTPEEFDVMKTHSLIGYQALVNAKGEGVRDPFLDLAAEIALNHHEKYNGKGYPNGLAGDDIPLSGRLVAMADVYDALTSERVYKAAMPHDKAKQVMLEEMAGSFDPRVVKAFLEVQEKFQAITKRYQD